MGANPFDVLESFDDVEALKKTCDYVIVLYHGGKEFLSLSIANVTKILQKIC